MKGISSSNSVVGRERVNEKKDWNALLDIVWNDDEHELEWNMNRKEREPQTFLGIRT